MSIACVKKKPYFINSLCVTPISSFIHFPQSLTGTFTVFYQHLWYSRLCSAVVRAALCLCLQRVKDPEGFALGPGVPALSTSLIPNNITLGSDFKQTLPATLSAEMQRGVLGSPCASACVLPDGKLSLFVYVALASVYLWDADCCDKSMKKHDTSIWSCFFSWKTLNYSSKRKRTHNVHYIRVCMNQITLKKRRKKRSLFLKVQRKMFLTLPFLVSLWFLVSWLCHSILIIFTENKQELKPLIFVLQFMLRMKI